MQKKYYLEETMPQGKMYANQTEEFISLNELKADSVINHVEKNGVHYIMTSVDFDSRWSCLDLDINPVTIFTLTGEQLHELVEAQQSLMDNPNKQSILHNATVTYSDYGQNPVAHIISKRGECSLIIPYDDGEHKGALVSTPIKIKDILNPAQIAPNDLIIKIDVYGDIIENTTCPSA